MLSLKNIFGNIITIFKNLYKKYLYSCNNLLEKNEILGNLVYHFFDKTTKFSSVLLFDLRFFVPFLLLNFCTPCFIYTESTVNFLVFIVKNMSELGFSAVIIGFKNELHIILQFLFLFNLLFLNWFARIHFFRNYLMLAKE